MKVLEFLRNGGTLEQLTEKYAIKNKQHSKYSNLFLLKYNQIDSPFSEQIVRECRGLILDRDQDWKVISRSFDRFFNYGEGHAAPIDWPSARVLEKLDGSLCVLYQYDNQWHVQTSGTPDASGEVEGFGFTFKDLFWQTWEKLGYELPFRDDDEDICYIFELMTKYNKIVCRYSQERIVFLGARTICECDTGCHKPYEEYLPDNKYYPIHIAPGSVIHTSDSSGKGITRIANPWEVVRSFPMTSFEEIVEACRVINPMDNEGFVIVSNSDTPGQFARVKVKSPQYVALNNLRDGHGPKRIIQIIRTNEQQEFLSYFPEWKEEYDKWNHKYNLLVNSIEFAWERNKHIESQKDFALAIKDIAFNGALFMMRTGKMSSVREYLANTNINNLVEYMEKQ